MTGAEKLQQAGKEEHAKGEGEDNAAQATGYAEGATDRLGGYKDSVMGAIKGDKGQQVEGELCIKACSSTSCQAFTHQVMRGMRRARLSKR